MERVRTLTGASLVVSLLGLCALAEPRPEGGAHPSRPPQAAVRARAASASGRSPESPQSRRDAGAGRASATPGPGARAVLDGRPIDLNRATRNDLVLLPRIGPTLAGRIVADRVAHGPFRTLPELARVKGIGPKTVARLRGLARVGAGEGAGEAGEKRRVKPGP